MKTLAFLATLSALASAPVFAAQGPHAFVRVEAGRSDQSASVVGLGESISDNDNTYSLRGGYFFTPHFGVEAFYSNLYDKSEGDASLKGTAAGLGVVGKYNFGADQNGFFVDARTGAAWGKIDARVGNIDDDSLNSVKPYVGIGGGYDFNENMGLSLNWDYLKASDQGVSVSTKALTVGFEYRF